jgi:TfoX/Sxy family transcriptional regulator of competence genes
VSTDSFREFALEQLAALDRLYRKRMFGGNSLHLGGAFFGILFDGRLDSKTHPDTLPDCLTVRAAALAPLEKPILMDYRKVTVEMPEDAMQLTAWTRKAAQ